MIYNCSPFFFWSTIEIVQFLIEVTILLHNFVFYWKLYCIVQTQDVSPWHSMCQIECKIYLKWMLLFHIFFFKVCIQWSWALIFYKLEAALSCCVFQSRGAWSCTILHATNNLVFTLNWYPIANSIVRWRANKIACRFSLVLDVLPMLNFILHLTQCNNIYILSSWSLITTILILILIQTTTELCWSLVWRFWCITGCINPSTFVPVHNW